MRSRTSFSQRGGRMPAPYLYTLCVYDTEKANKLKQSLPPGM
ncbi:hypothetical protein BAE44_0021988 [Dichanthelium oligosanthes]|uniref:Uncharacterized protein n=1 Tax=Dichanthelium oligosanthes TaxID=888268 RepID=A0A1E5UVW0_9POAL|nr:hypothetical protein BAE44_0021988 [Dichanthelium oligosanthes]